MENPSLFVGGVFFFFFRASVMQFVTKVRADAKIGLKLQVVSSIVAYIERGLWVIDMEILEIYLGYPSLNTHEF